MQRTLVVSLHSPHLAKLRQGGLVKTCRDSQAIYYSLSSHEAALLIECLHGEFLLIQSYTLKKAHNRHTGPVLAELAWQTYQKIK